MHKKKNHLPPNWFVTDDDTPDIPVDEEEEKVPFYSKDYTPYSKKYGSNQPKIECDTNNPVAVNNYFKRYVYKQEDYIKNLSLFLYNHVSGRPSVMLVSGPPGNGKTYAAKLLKDIYPDTVIWDTSGISQDGWRGNNKISDILRTANQCRKAPIIVLDEFDKLCRPQYSRSENVSVSLQSEFLKLFEGGTSVIGDRDSDKMYVDTSEFSWLLLGSFSEKADRIAKENSSEGIGFNAQKIEYKPYSENLTKTLQITE